MSSTSTSLNAPDATNDDPASFTAGFITKEHMLTNGYGIKRGLNALASLSSNVPLESNMKANYETIFSYVKEATGDSDPRDVMAVAVRDSLYDIVALARLFHVDLHEELQAAIKGEEMTLGLPTPSFEEDG